MGAKELLVLPPLNHEEATQNL